MEAGTEMVRELNHSTSIVLPPGLLKEAQRLAAEERWSVSEAVVFLAKCGAESQQKSEKELETSYQQFMADSQSPEAGDTLIRAIFGPDAIARD